MKLKKILKESNAPGFKDRKFGAPLPTLDSVKKAYESKKAIKEQDINERLDRPTLKRMEGLHHVQNMKAGLHYLRDVQGDLVEEGFDEQEVWEFFLYKMNQAGIGK